MLSSPQAVAAAAAVVDSCVKCRYFAVGDVGVGQRMWGPPQLPGLLFLRWRDEASDLLQQFPLQYRQTPAVIYRAS